MKATRGVFVACFVGLLCTASFVAAATPRAKASESPENLKSADDEDRLAKPTFRLQQSFNLGSTWHDKGTFTINPKSGLPTFGGNAAFSWKRGNLDALKASSLLLIRALDANGNVVAATTVSTCALLTTGLRSRSTGLYIEEVYGATASPASGAHPAQLHGLSFASSGRGDLCDIKEIVDAIKPDTTQDVRVVRGSAFVKSPQMPTLRDVPPPRGTAPAPNPKGEKGKDEAPAEDNRSFLQKYWIYIALFFVAQIFFSPKAAEAKQDGDAQPVAAK